MPPDKVLVIGLDAAVPDFVFGDWRHLLPNISALMQRGACGRLRSCDPPITIPAWSCMMSGKSPGRLGCYGFRNRLDHSYDKLAFATSRAIAGDRVWDIASQHGKHVIVLGVPQTYPPSKVNGLMVACFLTPDTSCAYTWPAELAGEVQSIVGDYCIDVDQFRSDDKQHILDQVYRISDQRFTLCRHFLTTRPWDFAMLVDMGIDRMQHAFWRFMDPQHPRYEPGSPYQHALRDFYIYSDRQIGRLLEGLDDSVAVLIVSDHGAQALRGGLCINEWLIREGFLKLRQYPAHPGPLRVSDIDWPATRAWAEGGYYARIFLNIAGREPRGCIPAERAEETIADITGGLANLSDNRGQPLSVRVLRPRDIYAEVKGIPPDLLVYFDDLAWRAIGSVGFNALHTLENDTGPDDANHARDGIWILAPADRHSVPPAPGDHNSVDIAPTVLDLLGLPVPDGLDGHSILDTKAAEHEPAGRNSL